jgi:pimeloyl-ACP methyl ester carboxylesterase
VSAPGPISHFIEASDGLRLHAVEYGRGADTGVSVICLPGLARTAADFEPLARALAGCAPRPRRVIAVDYRGRGRSEYDNDPAKYALPVELADLETVLSALSVGPAVFIGTSRGGILTMLMAASSPGRIAGAVLNDIGPVIEPAGLVRIKGYVGKLPTPRDLVEGAGILRELFAPQFPNLTEEGWREAATLTWREQDGVLVLCYDAELAKMLQAIEPDQVIPTLWPQFEALASVPAMVIHGALSDLLSAQTVEEMLRRRPDLEAVTVPDEGHPPRLGTPTMIARISAFVNRCEQTTGA